MPTPRLVALGEVEGIPLLLMTRLPGALVWQPTDVVPYLRRLAYPGRRGASALRAPCPGGARPAGRLAVLAWRLRDLPRRRPQRRAARRAPRLSPLQRAVGRREISGVVDGPAFASAHPRSMSPDATATTRTGMWSRPSGAATRRTWRASTPATGRCFSAPSPSAERAGSRSPRAAAPARRWRAAPPTGGTAGTARAPRAR